MSYLESARAAFRQSPPISAEFDAMHEAMFRVGPRRLHNSAAATVHRVARFLQHFGDGPVIDLGAGTGGLATFLAANLPRREIVGIEQNTTLFDLACAVTADFDLTNLTFNKADMTVHEPVKHATYVMINPLECAPTIQLAKRLLACSGTAVVTASHATQCLRDSGALPQTEDRSYLQLALWT